jgi:hypothetical protein
MASGQHAGTRSASRHPRLRSPSGASRDHVDRDQDDPDQEQQPRHLDHHQGPLGKVQHSGPQADHQKCQCVVEYGSLLSMECGRELNSPLEHGRSPDRLHEQALTPDRQRIRETLAQKRRRPGNQSRGKERGSARDRTVSGASHRTASHWAQ